MLQHVQDSVLVTPWLQWHMQWGTLWAARFMFLTVVL
jgi:hypothetical protein